MCPSKRADARQYTSSARAHPCGLWLCQTDDTKGDRMDPGLFRSLTLDQVSGNMDTGSVTRPGQRRRDASAGGYSAGAPTGSLTNTSELDNPGLRCGAWKTRKRDLSSGRTSPMTSTQTPDPCSFHTSLCQLHWYRICRELHRTARDLLHRAASLL